MLTRTIFTTLFIALYLSSFAQNRDEWFEFYLPWDDSTKTVTDLSGYLDAPAGKHGFVTVDEKGHFRFENSDEPIRFVGVDMGGLALFPTYEEAKKLAARMAKFGINAVSFHHIDHWAYGLFKNGRKNTMELDSGRLDKMNFFIKCLRDKGIYYKLDLHSARDYVAGDTIPAEIQSGYSKYVNLFNERLIYLHKDFAKKLLTTVNPHTGLSYANDPAMVSIDITNENSFFHAWYGHQKDRIFADNDEGIGEYYSNELDSLFNEWLSKKYKTTDALQTAWTNTLFSEKEILENGSFEYGIWYNYTGSSHSAKSIISNDSTDVYHGEKSAKIEVIQAGSAGWEVHLKSSHIKVEKDKIYQLVFYAKSNVEKSVSVSATEYRKEDNIWRGIGSISYTPSKNWQKIEYIFTSPFDSEEVFLQFNFGLQTGTFWFDSVSVKEFYVQGLEIEENLEQKNVKRCKYADFTKYSKARIADNAEFYYSLEGKYINKMMGYLKDDLQVKCPITFTNTVNEGIVSTYSLARADYMDFHIYWDHRRFPTDSTRSQTNFLITNRSMLKYPQYSTMNKFQFNRVKGKPLVLGEYNHSYPNMHQTEAPSLLYAYGSFFDMDGIFWHAYYISNQNYSRREQFNLLGLLMGSNPLILTQLPLSIPYRMNYISKAQTTIEASYNHQDVFNKTKTILNKRQLLMMEEGYGTAFLEHGFVHSSFNEDSSYLNQEIIDTGNIIESDTKELLWDGEKGIFTVNNPYWQGATGFLAGEHINLDDIEIRDVETTDGLDFASIQIIALDSTEIASSQKMLLLTSARLENEGLQWSADSTSVLNPGKDRSICEPVKLKLKFRPARADGFEVYQLNETGERVKLLPATIDESGATIQINSKTLWYEIVNSSNKDSIVSQIQPNQKHDDCQLLVSPNPCRTFVNIESSIQKDEPVVIEIYNILGKMVERININGSIRQKINVSGYSKGIYQVIVKTKSGLRSSQALVKE